MKSIEKEILLIKIQDLEKKLEEVKKQLETTTKQKEKADKKIEALTEMIDYEKTEEYEKWQRKNEEALKYLTPKQELNTLFGFCKPKKRLIRM